MAVRRVFPQQVRREFWRQVRAGATVAEAAEVVGASRFAGMDWYRDRGGVMPPEVPPAVRRPRLTFEQSEEIAVLHAAKVSNCEIARRVGCNKSTVGRELKVGSTTFPDRKPRYRASTAQLAADRRAQRSRGGKLAANPRLHAAVQTMLEDELSPEQISAQLKIDFPDEAEMRVSHETIYQALYVQGRGELRRDLHTRLRTGRAVRKVRRVGGERRGRWFARGFPEVDPAAVERFWSTRGWQRRPIDMGWSFATREDLESVVRIELPPAVAEAALAEHTGTEVDYAVNLWWRRY